MKNNRSGYDELKDFVGALTGKKEVDTIKTIFSDDGRVHYKGEKTISSDKKEKHKWGHDPAVDEFDSAEDFAEEYADDFDDEEEAMDYYYDEKEDDY